jgi:hypothetical protein
MATIVENDQLPSVEQALVAVKKAVGAVRKTERNQQQGFNFRGVDAVVNAAAPALNEHGVIILPEVQDYTYEVVEIGRNKTSMGHVVLRVKFRFVGPKGDAVSATTIGEAMDSGDKAFSKAHSIAYRIALLQVLNLPTDEPDPDHDVYERSGSSRGQDAPKASSSTAAAAARTKAAPEVSDEQVEELRILIKTAPDTDALNELFKKAGAIGALLVETVDPETGVKSTIQEFMYARADAIKSGNGSSAPAGRKTTARK